MCYYAKNNHQAVRRNISRFLNDFMFELTRTEWHEVVTICDHQLKYSRFYMFLIFLSECPQFSHFSAFFFTGLSHLSQDCKVSRSS